jgi:hypothetical protein
MSPPIHHQVSLTPTEAGLGSMAFFLFLTERLQN